MSSHLKQEGGNNTTNIQAAGNISIGITYEAARQIALDVFQMNFYKLSEQAAIKARSRAEELVNDFLQKFYHQHQNIINKLEDPSIQYSLYNVQREYAKTGDTELKEQLLKLLIERIGSKERSLKQIVLDEAIETLPKLSQEHLNLITLVFIVQNLLVKLFQKENIEGVSFDVNKLVENLKTFCVFSPKDLRQHVIGHLQYLGCIREVINDGNMFDSPVLTINMFVKKYCGHEVPDKEIMSTISSIHRNFALYYRIWKMRPNSIVKLTTVGLTIAIINYNKYANENIELAEYL